MDGRKGSPEVLDVRENLETKVGIVLPGRTHFVLNRSVLDRLPLGVDAAEMTNYSFLLL